MFKPHPTSKLARIMFGLGRQMFLFGIIVFVFSINLTAVAALKCRAGVDNSVGIVYWQETCDASQQACFKSVKCYTVGDTSYVDVDWRCIERSKCMNVTGKYVAYYKNVRGKSVFSLANVAPRVESNHARRKRSVAIGDQISSIA